MTASTLTTLVNGITGGHVMAFFLVLTRITPLFLIAPVFSSPALIPRVRTVLAIAIAFGLTPVVAHGVKLPTDALAFVGLMLEGFVVGFAIAFAVACMFAAVQSAGILQLDPAVLEREVDAALGVQRRRFHKTGQDRSGAGQAGR